MEVQGLVQLSFMVEHGLISGMSVSGALSVELSVKLAECLQGCRHEYDAVKTAVSELGVDVAQCGLSFLNLIDGLF